MDVLKLLPRIRPVTVADPQFMVTRHEHDRSEAFAHSDEGKLESLKIIADVASDDQSIVQITMRRQRPDPFHVLAEIDMEI